MEKLKIVINGNKEIAGQAKDLFKILGYYITTEKRDGFYGWSLGERCGDYYGNNLSFNEDPARLVTISELKDMVVLKRNNISDATHKSNINQMGYLTSNGVEYFWNYHFKKWNTLKGASFESEKLKPIKEEAMKETLNDKVATVEVARQESKNVDATLAERQSQYGCFEDVAFVTENIMTTLAKVRSNGLQDLPHTHRMALYMIASKMARIVNGDFNHLDSWHDIGGYSKLIEDLIGDGNEI
jgi:hypothetical protein